MWEIMIGDKQLAKIIFEHLLEVIALTLPYQEKEFGGTVTRTETHTAKAVSVVLVCELVTNRIVYGNQMYFILMHFLFGLKLSAVGT